MKEVSGAILSEDRNHRFQLWRIWDDTKPFILWIMHNPSKADENENDRTIEKNRYTKKQGGGSFYEWFDVTASNNNFTIEHLHSIGRGKKFPKDGSGSSFTLTKREAKILIQILIELL